LSVFKCSPQVFNVVCQQCSFAIIEKHRNKDIAVFYINSSEIWHKCFLCGFLMGGAHLTLWGLVYHVSDAGRAHLWYGIE